MVRAKFRVMEISQRWNGKVTVVRLLPVTAKARPEENRYIDPDGCEENRLFWEATPIGEAELVFKGLGNLPDGFTIGACLYLDMSFAGTQEPKEGLWELKSVKNATILEVVFRREWTQEGLMYGSVSMGIQNEEAWPHFQGKHLTYWDIQFKPASW